MCNPRGLQYPQQLPFELFLEQQTRGDGRRFRLTICRAAYQAVPSMETLRSKPYFDELQRAVEAVQLASTLCQVQARVQPPALQSALGLKLVHLQNATSMSTCTHYTLHIKITRESAKHTSASRTTASWESSLTGLACLQKVQRQLKAGQQKTKEDQSPVTVADYGMPCLDPDHDFPAHPLRL